MTDTFSLDIAYDLTCAIGESPERKALNIALEQTAELPDECINADIRQRIVGHVEAIEKKGPNRYGCVIRYPSATIGTELTQLLNVLFGNISLQQGIRVVDIHWPNELLDVFGGPLHGIDGLRRLTHTNNRPLLCTALKPMGTNSRQLAERCYHFALGGIDIIKDDHGVANQADSLFDERLHRCRDAVERANQTTGGNTLYFPNVTAPADIFPKRLEAAKDAGCRGVLIAPWITGLDSVRYARDAYGLALMAHPALTGAYFGSRHGILPELLLGDLFRIAGVDASIYPNAGGRFRFSVSLCRRINDHLRRPLGRLKPTWPTPGGGMNVQKAPYWVDRYGVDTILLIGGSLYSQGDLTAASRALLNAVQGS